MKRVVAASVLTVLVLACGGFKEDPVLELAAEESLEEGRRLMAEGKYRQARPYLTHAFEVEPNSVHGREGLLLAADSLFLAGGFQDLVKAEARYRDFINRFPTSDHAGYAQLQIGLSLARRIEEPDRDQSVSRQALAALEDVQRLFPESSYSLQAAEEIEKVRFLLAEHDVMVGRFYQRFGIPYSAIQRFEAVLEEYPGYPKRDRILYYMCQAYGDSKRDADRQKAVEVCRRLQNEYPDSELSKKVPKKVKKWASEVEEDGQDDNTASVPTDGGL